MHYGKRNAPVRALIHRLFDGVRAEATGQSQVLPSKMGDFYAGIVRALPACRGFGPRFFNFCPWELTELLETVFGPQQHVSASPKRRRFSSG